VLASLVEPVLTSPVVVALTAPVDVPLDVPLDVALTMPVDVVLTSPVDAAVASVGAEPPVGEVPVDVLAVPASPAVELELELAGSAVPSEASGSQPFPTLSHHPMSDIVAIQATLFIVILGLGTLASYR